MKLDLKKQRRTFMGYNMIALTIIFALFGLIIYNHLRGSLYAPVEKSIYAGRDMIMNSDILLLQLEPHRRASSTQLYAARSDDASGEKNAPSHFTSKARPNDSGEPPMMKIMPMRVQIIVRDADGKILNGDLLGRLYFENYLDDIYFSPDLTDKLETFQLGSSLYASLTFKKDEYFIQLISGLEGEQNVLDNIWRTLVIAIISFSVISVFASYFLSRLSMKPIENSWRRQSEFVENASHELRTPLTIIQNKLEDMLAAPHLPIIDKAEALGISLSETRRLAKLTADLMTLARADSNQQQLECEILDIDALLTDVCVPYAELALLQDKHFTLVAAAHKTLSADKNRLHQLIIILLDNALKYTSEGDSVFLRTLAEDNRIVIEVEDTGIGIPSESRAYIFDRFYRTDKARNRSTGGSGLGLSIAKWIVDAHGGSITALPVSSSGTLFRIILPLK